MYFVYVGGNNLTITMKISNLYMQIKALSYQKVSISVNFSEYHIASYHFKYLYITHLHNIFVNNTKPSASFTL